MRWSRCRGKACLENRHRGLHSEGGINSTEAGAAKRSKQAFSQLSTSHVKGILATVVSHVSLPSWRQDGRSWCAGSDEAGPARFLEK